MSVVALSGGIGGAKLALGLSRVLPQGALTVIANTGDDFDHLGLAISPDVDTLLYTLAGLDHPEQGWGRRDETWNFMAALESLGGETWFRLGDRDLALHVERTRRLAAGETLSAITEHLRRRLGIASRIVPMSDETVRTRLRTSDGWLDFQDYFVRLRSAPVVSEIVFVGADAARPAPGVLAALADPALEAIVICPSNPLISVAPILAVPGMRDAVAGAGAPVVAISPIIGGRAVKGPTAKMMAELGHEVSAASVADYYGRLIDGYVLDEVDAGSRTAVPTVAAPTLMVTLADREALARRVLAFARDLADGRRRAQREVRV